MLLFPNLFLFKFDLKKQMPFFNYGIMFLEGNECYTIHMIFPLIVLFIT